MADVLTGHDCILIPYDIFADLRYQRRWQSIWREPDRYSDGAAPQMDCSGGWSHDKKEIADIAMARRYPNPIDKYVGSRLRMRRLMLGMSQQKVGDELGITFQQVQKYEKGTNRVSASRLQAMCQILRVSIPYFFEGAPQTLGQPGKGAEPPSPTYVSDFLADSDGLKLVAAFTQIGDAKIRRSLVRLVEAMVDDVEDR